MKNILLIQAGITTDAAAAKVIRHSLPEEEALQDRTKLENSATAFLQSNTQQFVACHSHMLAPTMHSPQREYLFIYLFLGKNV